MHRKHLVAALAAAALAGTALGGPAVAGEPAAKPKASTLVKGLVSPLSLAVSTDGTVYYAQNFTGTLQSKKPGKKPKTIYQAETGVEVGAISEHQGSLRFALTFSDEEGNPTEAVLMGVGGNGKPVALADLRGYEETKNPDGDVTYGVVDAEEGCEVPPFLAEYTGIVDSHPYATLQVGSNTFIADAAGNDILRYRSGKLSTVAVLPPQPTVLTEAAVEANELPECLVGATLITEAVPTDVERGPDGKLYVSTLPGGPEDPSLGARASVYRVDPKTGKVKKVAGGLLSATGLAVDARGTIFVSELFRGRIAKIKPGASTPSGFLQAPLPGDVEVRSNGDVYATINALPPEEGAPDGRVIRIQR